MPITHDALFEERAVNAAHHNGPTTDSHRILTSSVLRAPFGVYFEKIRRVLRR